MGIEQQQCQHGHLQGNRDEHQTEIGRRGVRQRALDINLGNRNKGTADGADRANHLKHHESHRRVLQQGHDLEQHDRTTGHHNGIAQNRGRVRTLHGLIKPEVHGELGALAGWSCHQSKTEQSCSQWRQGVLGRPAVEIIEARNA